MAFIATDSGDFDVADGAFARTPDPNSRQVIVEANEALEQDFVTPLLVITGTEKKTVYFLVGHGEKSLSSMDDNSTSADIVDQASSYTEKNVEMRAINRQIKLISKIDSALKRIEDGTYGYCDETGDPILA